MIRTIPSRLFKPHSILRGSIQFGGLLLLAGTVSASPGLTVHVTENGVSSSQVFDLSDVSSLTFAGEGALAVRPRVVVRPGFRLADCRGQACSFSLRGEAGSRAELSVMDLMGREVWRTAVQLDANGTAKVPAAFQARGLLIGRYRCGSFQTTRVFPAMGGAR